MVVIFSVYPQPHFKEKGMTMEDGPVQFGF